MQEKLKQLELLISQLLARQKEVQAENATLKNRLRVVEDQVDKLKGSDAEMRALKDWKKNTQAALKRLAAKVDKEIAKAKESENKIV